MAEPMPRRLIIVLGALSAFGPLSVDMYLPAVPDIGRSLHTSASSVQLTLTACTLGLGVGQLVAGPLSDTLGRRRPLLVGLVAFLAFSLGCAVAPSLPLLVAFRFLQALGGSAGLVIARAVARDLRDGPELAHLFALLLLVNGTAPVLAPIIGGQLVRFTSWRGVFVVLAGVGVALVVATTLIVRETLPPARRRPGSLPQTFRTYRELLRDRTFVVYVVTGALAFGTMFAYISGSPFALEDNHGLSPQLFSAVFGTNAVGLIAASLVGARLAVTHSVRGGLLLATTGAVFVLASALGAGGLAGLLAGFFLITSGYGMLAPRITALALSDHPEAAGSASAVLGSVQFGLGGVVGPLVGIGGSGTVVPLGITVVISSTAALAVGLRRTGRAGRP